MHALVSVVAQYGLYVVALIGLVVWLRAPRSEKVLLALEVVIAALAVAMLVKVAGAVHTDPRPFVVDPSLTPYFPHPRDNGFPSDHTALASAISFVVLRRHRAAGLVMLALSVALGAARVAAHVHHVQDIVAGLVIGLVAAAAGVVLTRAVARTAVVGRFAHTR